MLGRGVPTGHIITVLGSFGTGKTTFALQFLMQGLINGEKAIFISLEEDADSVIANAASFGWDLPTYIKEKKLHIVKLEPADAKNDRHADPVRAPGLHQAKRRIAGGD